MIDLSYIKAETYTKAAKALDKIKGSFDDMVGIAVGANPAIMPEDQLMVDENVNDMFYNFHQGLLAQYTELLNRVCSYVEREYKGDDNASGEIQVESSL